MKGWYKIMEKIKLANGTELEILGGATSNSVSVNYEQLADLDTYVNNLTEDNLEEYSILNESGEVCTTLTNKYLSSISVNPTDKVATFHLADVDMMAKRLAALEATQEIQDEAIVELAEMTAGGEE